MSDLVKITVKYGFLLALLKVIDLLGRQDILDEKHIDRFQASCQLERTSRAEVFMDIVEQFHLPTDLVPNRTKELGNGVHVKFLVKDPTGVPCLRPTAHTRLNESASTVSSHLYSNMTKTILHPTPYTLSAGLKRRTPTVGVQGNRVTSLTPKELIDGHPGAFSFDIPERRVQGCLDDVGDRAVPPIGSNVIPLLHVFDSVGVLTDPKGVICRSKAAFTAQER